MKEAQKVLDELKEVKPEELTGEAKRLFEAIMKIADERDELEYKYNKALDDLMKCEKEIQADKERIKELEEGLENSSNRVVKLTRENTKLKYELFHSIHEDKIKEIVDECIPKGNNIITGKKEYQPNANANSFLTQRILELLKDGGE